MELPKTGVARAELATRMKEAKTQVVDWRGGRIGVYIH